MSWDCRFHELKTIRSILRLPYGKSGSSSDRYTFPTSSTLSVYWPCLFTFLIPCTLIVFAHKLSLLHVPLPSLASFWTWLSKYLLLTYGYPLPHSPSPCYIFLSFLPFHFLGKRIKFFVAPILLLPFSLISLSIGPLRAVGEGGGGEGRGAGAGGWTPRNVSSMDSTAQWPGN